MPHNELDSFITTWEIESQNTLRLLRALPHDQYDFRPDAGGRSLGELAWHLAEGDAYMTFGIENGNYDDRTSRDDVRYVLTYASPYVGYEGRVIRDVLAAYPRRAIVARFEVTETGEGDRAVLVDKFGVRDGAPAAPALPAIPASRE